MGTNPAKLASSSTPKNKITYEYFAKGTEPTEISTTYRKLSNVTNLSASYDIFTGNVTLNWSAAAEGTDYDESYGKFGYRIYINDSYLGFTTDTAYTVTGQSNPIGTYKVVTTYENYSEIDSPGAITKITEEHTDTSTYTASIQANTKLKIGDHVNSCLVTGTVDSSCVILFKDGNTVSDGYSVTVTIADKDGDTVAIDTSYADTYTATFRIEYKGSTKVTKSVSVTVN